MTKIDAIALIPARLGATRFPKKLLQMLGDKTVIRTTYEQTVATGLFNEVYVVTDHESIYNEIVNNGGKALMSQKEHESGTDRIAEVAANLEADVFLNVQGDEPFVERTPLHDLLQTFHQPETKVASLMRVIKTEEQLKNPNIVKVTVDKNFRSLLFSRSPIPYVRDHHVPVSHYEHIGVYAFRKQALLQFTQLEPTPLELVEKIECLRFLENGIHLQMVVTETEMVKIDVPEDLPKAIAFLEQLKQG